MNSAASTAVVATVLAVIEYLELGSTADKMSGGAPYSAVHSNGGMAIAPSHRAHTHRCFANGAL